MITCRDVRSLWRAIRNLSVRGAPALGAAAAFGILLGLKDFKGRDARSLIRHVKRTADYLRRSRPTAVNLFHALDRMESAAKGCADRPAAEIRALLEKEARLIYNEDRVRCRALGAVGQRLIKRGMNVLTICNTGALATVDYGTALGVLFAAQSAGKRFHVYACETRPLLQGSRLTAWELTRAKIPCTLIGDSMAASLMRDGRVDLVIVGADRIAANGDTANKIGTYALAVLARHHRVPFYVAAPTSTIDKDMPHGRHIVIEQRDPREITHLRGIPVAAKGVKVHNPAFDVTPHQLITGIITEKGIKRFR
jgi:methylthioribose-1-phosphate isomerase